MSAFRFCRYRVPVVAARVVVLALALSVPLWAIPPSARAGLGPPAAGAARSSNSAPRRYVVLLRQHADAGAVARDHSRRLGARVSSIYSGVRGYAAVLTSARAAAVAADKRVQAVEPDLPVRLHVDPPGPPRRQATPQSRPPWNLDRLDQTSGLLDGVYRAPGSGEGVTAYVIDTGIRYSHHEFGGRAVSGFDAIDGGAADDCNGHGTHVAGTIGGRTLGVAQAVRLVGVRVLDCRGRGSTAAVVAGIDWVTAHHRPGTPSVANVSLGGPASGVIDKAVERSSASGVAYVVAAGNDGRDACLQSPARVPAAITVGASDPHDRRPPWSSTGQCVDIYAPGVGIRSAWLSGDDDSRVLDGTSMASPHVAGAAAVYLQLHPRGTPRTVATGLRAWALPRAVSATAGGGGDLLHVGPRSR